MHPISDHDFTDKLRATSPRPAKAAVKRRMKETTAFVASVFSVFLITSSPRISEATITIVEGFPTGVSTFDLGTTSSGSTTTQSGTLTIWGGVAGPACSAGSESTCNSCDDASEDIGDNGLIACNRNRIHAGLNIVIDFKSDKADGIPLMLPSSTSGGSAIPLGTGSTSTTTSKGSIVRAVIPWQNLCNLMVTSPDGRATSDACTPTQNTNATYTFQLGIDSNNDNALDDSKTVVVNIMNGFETEVTDYLSLQIGCKDKSTAPDNQGICYFAVNSGDAKVSAQIMDPSNLFPLGENTGSPPTTFKKIRYLYSAESHEAINAATSNYQDLNITSTGTNSTFDVDNEAKIKGLNNDQLYYFKVAMVDQAGNVGYYTQASDDLNCRTTETIDGQPKCHIGKPGEVLGVLANDVNCFVATAAYGSPMAPKVQMLREFRDQILFRSIIGRKFIHFYNLLGPDLAHAIRDSEPLREMSRVVLWPAVGFAEVSLRLGVKTAVVVTLLFFGLMFTLFLLVRQNLQRLGRVKTSISKSAMTGTAVIAILLMQSPTHAGTQIIAANSTEPTLNAEEDDDVEPVDPDAAVEQDGDIVTEQEAPPPAEYPYPGAKDEGVADGTIPATTGTTSVLSVSPFATGSSMSPTIVAPKPLAKNPETGEYFYGFDASQQDSAAQLRMGFFAPPDLQNPENGVFFRQIYTSADIPTLFFDYEWQLTRRLGDAGFKIGTGVFYSQGSGRFKAKDRSDERPDEKFTFAMLPNTASLIYRFRYADSQFIVPYAEGGGGFFTFAEIRSDGKNPKFGGAAVAVAAGGLSFLLDWLDRSAIRELDREYGINHVWINAEYRMIVGLNPNYDFSSRVIGGGVMTDF